MQAFVTAAAGSLAPSTLKLAYSVVVAVFSTRWWYSPSTTLGGTGRSVPGSSRARIPSGQTTPSGRPAGSARPGDPDRDTGAGAARGGGCVPTDPPVG